MSKQIKFTRTLLFTGLFGLYLSGCSTSDGLSNNASLSTDDLVAKSEALTQREMELAKREAALSSQYSQAAQSSPAPMAGGDLLPPKAQAGECYARVWVEATYKERQEQVLVSEASESINIIPARYETGTEQVLSQVESSRLITIPAEYENVSEQRLVKEGGVFWRTELKSGAPVSQSLLETAQSYGINTTGASPGDCFHEHFKPAEFAKVRERVLIKEESEVINPIEAEYRWVEKQIQVSEASTRLEQVPASYETQTEQILDKPAHTVWKKGSGPIQKIDAATGEIMCLVEVPASYRTISKRVLVSPASTREVEIPAQFKTVKVRELVSDASETRSIVPAQYSEFETTKQVSEPSFVWHEVHDNTMSASTRTGRKICMVEEKPQYRTITKRVVKTPASTRTELIPAQYETVTVQKLVSDAKEMRTVIPASYKTVSIKEIDQDGRMEWRSILCETNMTRSRIRDVQQALLREGFDPGSIDGVIGGDTIRAVNEYQRANSLPVDRYLNIQTLKSLKVSTL